MTPVAARIVNDASYVTTMKHASLSAWQAQYLVRLDRDTCCCTRIVNDVSYVRRIKHGSHFA